jgi:hypothetical protein
MRGEKGARLGLRVLGSRLVVFEPVAEIADACVEQVAGLLVVSSGPLLAVELENGNAPEFRGRFDVRTVTFDVPIRPPFAPSPGVAQSRP